MKCSICRSADTVNLPCPNASRSIISDGSIAPIPLHKSSCPTCGAISHTLGLSQDEVRAFYSKDYDLGLANSSFDQRRGEAYAGLVERLVGARRPLEVLEIGCGGGIVLDTLARSWPWAHLTGLEAAASLTARPVGSKVRILNHYLEDFPAPPHSFDLVFAINVVEHAAEPQRFLSRIAALLKPEGIAALVFPSARPNLELLFLDHVHTFTDRAFAILAARSGLRFVENAELDSAMGDFQYAVLAPADRTPASDRENALVARNFGDLSRQRVAYLAAWQQLDTTLEHRVAGRGPVCAFGAGEAATLLRAYAPNTWDRVSHLLVDEATGARRLGKPVSTIASFGELSRTCLLLATHPRSQQALAARFNGSCAALARWDDIIDK